MPQDSRGTPEEETAVDVFEHEIEELERPVWRESKIHPLIVIGGAAVLALSLGVAFFLISGGSKPSGSGVLTIMTIDTIEPRGSLTARPTRFTWESIARTGSYIVTVREREGLADLIARETTSTSIELTPEEAVRLVMGGRYTWLVRARSPEGWTIGEGGGAFSL